MLALTAHGRMELTDVGLICGTIVAFLAAAKVLHKLIKSWISKIATWIKQEITQIVRTEIKPLKASVDMQEMVTATFRIKVIDALMQIDTATRELTPNDGSHFRDTVDEISKSVAILVKQKET